MLKNSKFWRGIAVLFALCLVVGGAFLLNSAVDAAGTVVTYYVSENGDNTTGEDEATAFTSIETAITNANALALPVGSEVKIIVVDRVVAATEKIDGKNVTDVKGNKVHVTITSYQDSEDPADFSEIYLTCIKFENGVPDELQRAIVSGWVTFKNIRINAKLYEGLPVPSNKDTAGKDYCIRYLNLNGIVEMDNVDLTNEDILKNGSNSKTRWTVYGDHQTNISISNQPYYKKNLAFRNCDWTGKVSWLALNDRTAPGYDLTYTFENFRMASGHIAICRGSSRRLEVNFKDGTFLNSIYMMNNKTHTVSEGLFVNYYPGVTINSLWGSDGVGGTFNGNITQNFYGGSFADSTVFAKTYELCLGVPNIVKGDMTTNIYGGTFNKNINFAGTKGYSVNGTVTNNIYDGTFTTTVHLGKSANTAGKANKINHLVNNISGGTFKGIVYGASVDGDVGTYEANISGGTFKNAVHLVNSNVEGDAKILISGGSFDKDVYGFSGADATKTFGGNLYLKVTNVEKAGLIRAIQKGASIQGDVDFILDTTDSAENSINLPNLQISSSDIPIYGETRTYVDGGAEKKVTVGTFYGGASEKLTVNHLKNCTVTTFGGIRNGETQNIQNTLENVKITDSFHGGTGSTSLKSIAKDVTNTLNNCEIKYFYGWCNGKANTSPCDNVTNIFNGGKTTGNIYTGSRSSQTITGDLKNYYTNCEMIGINCGGSYAGTVKGSVYNYAVDSSCSNTFFGAGYNCNIEGSVYNYYTNFDLPCGGVSGLRSKGSIGGDIVTVINGGTFCNTRGTINGGTSVGPVGGKISLTIENGTFKGAIYGASPEKATNTTSLAANNDVSLTIKGGTFSTTVCGAYISKEVGDINLSIYDGTFSGSIYAALIVTDAASATIKGDVTTTVADGAFNGSEFYAVAKSSVTHDGSVNFTVQGGTFKNQVDVTRAVYPTDSQTEQNVEITVNGGTFKGNFYGLYGTKVNGDVSFTVTNGAFNGPLLRILRGGTSGAGGDYTVKFDTTGLDTNRITLSTGMDVFGDATILGTATLYVDGGVNRSITMGGILTGAPGRVKTVNTVKNANITEFHGIRSTSSANAVPLLENYFENVVIDGHFAACGHATNDGLYSYVEKASNTLKDCIVKGNFRGGIANYATGSYCKEIETTIINSTFKEVGYTIGKDETIYLSSFCGGNVYSKEPATSVTTTILGGTFESKVYAGRSTAMGVPTKLILNASEGPITFVKGVGALDSAESIELVGSANPIRLDADATLTLDAYDNGTQVFQQTESWTADQVYVQFPAGSDTSKVKVFNLNENVIGLGKVEDNTVKGVAGVVGNLPAAPTLANFSFHLSDTLGIRFWVNKAAVQAYIDSYGSWTYSASFKGNRVAGATFTSMDQFDAADFRTLGGVEYVTFYAGLELTSVEYGEEFTVSVSGAADATFTVYELLEKGIAAYNTADPEFALLLRSMYNYGAEAYNVFRGGNVDVKYADDVPAPATPAGSAFATGTEGYNFYATSITLAEKVTLNYYFNAPGVSASDLSITAVDANGKAVAASKIKVREIAGASQYNMIISLELTIPEMAGEFTVLVGAGNATVATCTNSVPYACKNYVTNPSSEFAPVSKALLSVIENTQPLLARA